MAPWQRDPQTGHFYTRTERDFALDLTYTVCSELRRDVRSPDNFYAKLEGSVKMFLPFVAISRRLLTTNEKSRVKDLTQEAKRWIVSVDGVRNSDVSSLLAMSGEAVADAENHPLPKHLTKYEGRYHQFFPDGHAPLSSFERTTVNFLSYILGGRDWRQWDLRNGKTSVQDLYFSRGMNETAVGALANAFYRTEVFDIEAMLRRSGWNR